MRLFLIFHLFHLLLYESDSMICADDDDDDDGMEDEQKNQLIILKIVALQANSLIHSSYTLIHSVILPYIFHTPFVHSHTLHTLYTLSIQKVYRVYRKCIECMESV